MPGGHRLRPVRDSGERQRRIRRADAHWDDAAWWDEQERAMWHGGHGSLTGNGVRHRCRAHPEDFLLAGRLTTRQLTRSETGGFDAFS